MEYTSFQQILEAVSKNPRKSRVAVAGAGNDHVLESVFQAEELGLVTPVLIGDEDRIRTLTREMGKDPDHYRIIASGAGEECGQAAVDLIREGEADYIMKGLLETREVLKPLVNKANGLHTGRTMSHMAFDEVPGFRKLVILTDGGMIPHPTLEEKRDIIINAVSVLRSMGYERPKVAILCGVEKVNPKMPETVDAEALVGMARDGVIRDCDIAGPISYDLVVDKESARIKGFDPELSGEFDILVPPSLAAGNILNKCLTLTAGGKMAGLVVGAKVPVVVTSRGSSSEEKLLSLAVASLVTQQEVQ